ncbi:metal-dependent hydrolase [Halospeciosus flavus]|uniref:Metal-dependent hydrolase n=2 Tax=Halospeciosus flavus TaxID=3032283 RepID=A0ABD5Z867_9EURY
MATTHALVGLALAAVSVVSGDVSPLALWGGFLGGAFPDLDLYAGHRKTLHFPVYYGVAAVAAFVALALPLAAVPGPWLAALAFFLLAAAVHSAMDALGGGLELRPWEGTSERAVYSHFHRRWIRPRRWIRYDGAPEDLALALVAAGPAWYFAEGLLQQAVVAVVVVSAGYVLVRKRMVHLAEALVARLPDPVLQWVPERFVADLH